MEILEKSKEVWRQVDELGIDRNLLYEIGGGLDNIETLLSVISENIEDFERYLKNFDVSKIAIDNVCKIMRLINIVENEHKNTDKYLNRLIEQIEK